MRASEVLKTASALVSGDREKTHGPKLQNHMNIAGLWTPFLRDKLKDGAELTPLDVALMLALLKIARTKAGSHNVDDYVDLAGYAGVAGEIASNGAGR